MKIVIETVGPERAAELLKTNTSNYRNLNAGRVNAYASDMKNGKWEFNGEAVKISKSGVLKDGQHRLAAIVKSGVSVQMLIIYGVDDDVSIYDVAQARSSRQIALASGLPSQCAQTATISAARMLLTPKFGATATPTGTVLDYLNQHTETFTKAWSIAIAGAHNPIAKKSVCIAAVYCLLRLGKSEDSLFEFFTVVNSGFQSENRVSSSAIVLRNAMLSPSNDFYRHGYDKADFFSTIILAYQDFENGRARKLKYKPDLDLTKAIINRVLDLDKACDNVLEFICG